MSNVNNSEIMSTLEFVNDEEREHFARAQLGEQVLQFLGSPAGRYLHGRAKLQLKECMAEILECNLSSWFGRRKAKKIQQRADTAKLFMRWCADAIQEGEISYRELQEYNN